MYNNDKNKSKALPTILSVVFAIIGAAIIFLIINAF